MLATNFSLNYLAIVVAALANFVIGFIFHSPPLGNLWMKLAHIKMTGKEKMSDMVPHMIKNLVSNIVFSTGLWVFIFIAAASSGVVARGAGLGVLCSLIIWLCFVVPTTSIEVIWMGKSAKLWLYETACSFVACVVMGAILGAW